MARMIKSGQPVEVTGNFIISPIQFQADNQNNGSEKKSSGQTSLLK
jgi:hypothetical protein